MEESTHASKDLRLILLKEKDPRLYSLAEEIMKNLPEGVDTEVIRRYIAEFLLQVALEGNIFYYALPDRAIEILEKTLTDSSFLELLRTYKNQKGVLKGIFYALQYSIFDREYTEVLEHLKHLKEPGVIEKLKALDRLAEKERGWFGILQILPLNVYELYAFVGRKTVVDSHLNVVYRLAELSTKVKHPEAVLKATTTITHYLPSKVVKYREKYPYEEFYKFVEGYAEYTEKMLKDKPNVADLNTLFILENIYLTPAGVENSIYNTHGPEISRQFLKKMFGGLNRAKLYDGWVLRNIFEDILLLLDQGKSPEELQDQFEKFVFWISTQGITGEELHKDVLVWHFPELLETVGKKSKEELLKAGKEDIKLEVKRLVAKKEVYKKVEEVNEKFRGVLQFPEDFPEKCAVSGKKLDEEEIAKMVADYLLENYNPKKLLKILGVNGDITEEEARNLIETAVFQPKEFLDRLVFVVNFLLNGYWDDPAVGTIVDELKSIGFNTEKLKNGFKIIEEIFYFPPEQDSKDLFEAFFYVFFGNGKYRPSKDMEDLLLKSFGKQRVEQAYGFFRNILYRKLREEGKLRELFGFYASGDYFGVLSVIENTLKRTKGKKPAAYRATRNILKAIKTALKGKPERFLAGFYGKYIPLLFRNDTLRSCTELPNGGEVEATLRYKLDPRALEIGFAFVPEANMSSIRNKGYVEGKMYAYLGAVNNRPAVLLDALEGGDAFREYILDRNNAFKLRDYFLEAAENIGAEIVVFYEKPSSGTPLLFLKKLFAGERPQEIKFSMVGPKKIPYTTFEGRKMHYYEAFKRKETPWNIPEGKVSGYILRL